ASDEKQALNNLNDDKNIFIDDNGNKHVIPTKRKPLRKQSFTNRVNRKTIKIENDKVYVNGKFSHMSTRHRNTDKEIANLHPIMRKKMASLINKINNSQNKYRVQISNNNDNPDCIIYGGYRLPAEQAEAFSHGRTGKNKNKPIITWAKPLRSNHNYGLAVDLTVVDLKTGELIQIKKNDLLVSLAKKCGLNWGGDFKSKKKKDPPHFEMIIKKFSTNTKYLDYLENKYLNEQKEDGYIKIN
ncbi:MAG: M15 family metallopeptidase, partial [bacterium]|nr:M15 family metallopeptidase [bacterium]